MYDDMAVDLCVLRYQGDLLGWKLVQFGDDLKDWFYQCRLHISEHYKASLVFKKRGAAKVTYYQETVMGMGFHHTSNISQRFSITLLIMWYEEFDALDAAFLEEECSRNDTLVAMLKHRRSIPQHVTEQRQDRLHAGHFFTDDFAGLILEPPHHSRLATAITAWHNVTTRLRVLTAAPKKRFVGVTVPWTGIITISCLALLVLPQDKVLKCVAWLVECIAGTITVQEYEKMAGLITFARFALGLPKRSTKMIHGPLRKGAEKEQGRSQRVKASKDRVRDWNTWIGRMLSSHGAPATWSLSDAPKVLQPSERFFVWHQDAAVKGTRYPALGAYSHGMYWVLPLEQGDIEELTIGPLELLAILGSIIIFGALMPEASTEHPYSVLLQSNSLTSSWKLHNEKGKSDVMDFIHDIMIHRPEYKKLSPVLSLGQVFGEGNPLSDNLSRGDMDVFFETCRLLGVKPKELQVPAIFKLLVKRVREFAKAGPARAP
jgi:hypothetical protein